MKMKTATIFAFVILLANIASSTTRIVDINGGGSYTRINAAIQASVAGDTVKVWPGTFNEQVNLYKDVVLMGSGYENTIIIGNFNPSVIMSSGKMQWFRVTSLAGYGISLTGGILTNCVISSCANTGVYTPSGSGPGSASIINCVIINNGGNGVNNEFNSGSNVSVVNCISRNNTGYDFYGSGSTLSLSYSNGNYAYTSGNQGTIDCDPSFTMAPFDFHIPESSCSWNTGNPSLSDPDGSRSNMGYFGGPDCPIYPVVTEILITPGVTTINLQAKARANY